MSDINLSIDDRYLYVSCWGTGEFIQYDVSDPFKPKKVSSLRLGGIVSRAAHPSRPGQMLNGGPQMVEISRDGKRIYFTNGLYTPWDDQFYPDGVRGWMAKVNVRPEGGIDLDPRFFLESDGMRIHQGWLFAVALGMQQGNVRGVLGALPPIALGHAVAVGAVVLAAGLAGLVVPIGALKIVVASILMMLGLHRLWRHRHPRFGGMQVGFRDLTIWPFLMASAHGAGFMVLPFVLGVPAVAASEHAGHMVARDTGVPWTDAMAVGVHTLAYLLVTTLVASVVCHRLGLRLLRTAWINLDWLWAGALVITGTVVLLT